MTEFSQQKTDIGLRHDPGPQDLTLTPGRQEIPEQTLRDIKEKLSPYERSFLINMFHEIVKRDMQICTSEVSLDHFNPVLRDDTACESATHVPTKEADEPNPKIFRRKQRPDVIIAYHDLLKARYEIQQSSKNANQCQDEDTLTESGKTLRDAQNRFVQASRHCRISSQRLKIIRDALRSETCATNEEEKECRDISERTSVNLSWVMPLSINIQIKR
ncbi:uncharacterized protein N7483_012646 [Penicillium malachiteum]|uniref:uncharacterized protein n=1 Tax=Penicillium malachiteum TaxID=1324776 RepID=UPI0025491C3A|nr:uncharacterized protein N7483_012646 [Penicillium malachiteum]KAJ5715465.1 hypothetical protein N7483_012646 [Penicillium malachiteum]